MGIRGILAIAIGSIFLVCPACADDDVDDKATIAAVMKEGLMMRVISRTDNCNGDALCRRRAERAGMNKAQARQALAALLIAVEQSCAGRSCGLAGNP